MLDAKIRQMRTEVTQRIRRNYAHRAGTFLRRRDNKESAYWRLTFRNHPTTAAQAA